MRYFANYLLGVLIFAPLLGFVAKFAARLVRVDIRFVAAVASTTVGYIVATIAVKVIGLSPGTSMSQTILAAVLFCAMLLAHGFLLRSRDKERIGWPRAALLAFAQLLAGVTIVLGVNSFGR
jgi:hypothetical protein